MRIHATALGLLVAATVVAGCSSVPGGPRTNTTVAGRGSTISPGVMAPSTAVKGAPPVTVARDVSATPRPSAPGAFPGDVAPGFVRWGAAIGGNADPVARHESIAGVPMGLRRTYFGWSNRMKAVDVARADLAAGRVPWVSFKTPGWAAMASGQYDADIDALLRGLGSVGGPVWLTVHHEPEGGGGSPVPDDPGGAPAWRAMQQRVRERITATGVRNVAFAPVLMSWTFDPRSGRNPLDWWVPGVWDFAGVDHYSSKATNTTMQLPMWLNTRAFYTARGLKIAVGEWGNRGTDATAATEMQAFYGLAVQSGFGSQSQVIGLAYFDSDLSSPSGGWTLQGVPLDWFRQLMRNPASLRASQTGF